jgi:hypothetical protein
VGKIYYVKNGGKDSQTGISDAEAWACHPWMCTWTGSVTLMPGDTIRMKRGDSWIASGITTPFMEVLQNGNEGSYITTTAYGTGALPLINISTPSNSSVIFSRSNSFIMFDSPHLSHYSSAIGDSRMCGIWLYGRAGACHDIIVTNCEINNIPYYAIIASDNAYNITVGDINATSTATRTNFSNHIHHFGYCGICFMGSDPITLESHFNLYFNYIHDGTRINYPEDEYGMSFTAGSNANSWPK